MAKPDLSFVRGGRALHEWLPEVGSPDPRTSRRAGDALAAMFHALPSVHTDFEDIEGELPTDHEHTDAWRREVRGRSSGRSSPDAPSSPPPRGS